MSEPLLTARDVQNELQISYTTLWRLIKRGNFPQPIMVGDHRRWRRADVDQFCERNRAKPAA
ncbi:MAG: helix-turn-helix domain-containing protein [Spirochaetaceae bacterium]|nr:helix-turn-helix domain-containing protein [Spirochaetaceae bacterium]